MQLATKDFGVFTKISQKEALERERDMFTKAGFDVVAGCWAWNENRIRFIMQTLI